MGKERPLNVTVKDGELVIRIGVNVLASAVARGDDFHEYDDPSDQYLRNFAITDATQFARDVAIALEHEEENGSSPLTRLLDEMAQAAIDDGSTGVEHNQKIKFEEKSPNEKW